MTTHDKPASAEPPTPLFPRGGDWNKIASRSDPPTTSPLRNRRARLLLALLLTVFLTVFPALPGRAAGKELDSGKIDSLVNEAIKVWKVPGCAVAIVKGDEVYLKGYGVREQGKPLPVTPDTLFGIGSCTKAMVATALAALVDDGKVSWDDHVRKHVPFFRLKDPLANRDVTLRDLLCHRTGLASHDLLWHGAPWTLEESVRRMAHLDPDHSFRSRYHYNNLAYITLGFAVSSASGQPWNQFLRKRLFDPLGMKGVVFTRSEVLKSADHASPHVLDEGKVKVISWYDDDRQVRGSGSVKAGVRDLSRWVRFQLAEGMWEGKRLVSREALLETRRPQIVTPSTGRLAEAMEVTQSGYGLGWHIYDYRGHLAAVHGGAVDGFRARIALIPKEKLGVVVLSNLAPGELPTALACSLLDLTLGLKAKDWNGLLLGQRERLLEREKKAKKAWRASRQPGTKPSRELDAYEGEYEHAAYGKARVSLEKGKLVLAWGNSRLPLEHFHHDTFVGQGPDRLAGRAAVFNLDERGTPARLRFLGQEFRRVKP
jgi:CubicO group peptidase (beta-lactamase class C family)